MVAKRINAMLHIFIKVHIVNRSRRGDRGGFIFFRLVQEASFITFYSPFEGL